MNFDKDKKNFYNGKNSIKFRQKTTLVFGTVYAPFVQYETSVYFTYGNIATVGARVRGAKV